MSWHYNKQTCNVSMFRWYSSILQVWSSQSLASGQSLGLDGNLNCNCPNFQTLVLWTSVSKPFLNENRHSHGYLLPCVYASNTCKNHLRVTVVVKVVWLLSCFIFMSSTADLQDPILVGGDRNRRDSWAIVKDCLALSTTFLKKWHYIQ